MVRRFVKEELRRNDMAKANGYTITKADAARLKAKDAKMTPAQRRAVSKGLVEANTAANRMKSKGR